MALGVLLWSLANIQDHGRYTRGAHMPGRLVVTKHTADSSPGSSRRHPAAAEMTRPKPAFTSVMTPVGFEPTQLALVELESTPLDHSSKVSLGLGPE